MMLMPVSTYKYEYSIRLLEKLSNEIIAKNKELNTVKGLFKKIKLKLQLRKLYKEIYFYGNNVYRYEYNKANKYYY